MQILRLLYRTVVGLFRYVRPLVNGGGLLILLALLVRAVLEPFAPSDKTNRREEPPRNSFKPIVPRLESRLLSETRPRPQRLKVVFPDGRDVPEAATAEYVFGLDSAGRVLDSFHVLAKPKVEPLTLRTNAGAFARKAVRVVPGGRARSFEPDLVDRIGPVPSVVRSEFEGASASYLSGRLKQLGFRGEGKWAATYPIDERARLVHLQLQGNSDVCGRFLVVNPSRDVLKDVSFRVDLLDSTGQLVRTETGRVNAWQIGAHDTVVVEDACGRLRPEEHPFVRHVRIKAIEAQVQGSPEWKLPRW